MLRDFKFLRRKNDEPENIPVSRNDLSAILVSSDSSRAPLNAIQEPTSYTKQEQEAGGGRSKVDKTPSKVKTRVVDPALPLRTPDKYGAQFSARQRFGWAAQKNELGATTGDLHDLQVRGAGISNGGFANMTPRTTTRTIGRAGSNFSETNSTQSTPTKSVSKPPGSSLRSKVDGVGGARTGNFAALYKGTPIPSGSCTVVNTVEVPHFDLKENPSFWMEHNVQVAIRVRPLNSMERSTNGYNRCLKQESFNTISWIGHPETRFTFDHVACETVDQEMLFRMACLPMVENCLSGYNSCMFAYGQTGSGKTYTMLGDIENLEVKPSPHRGMTPRIFEFLFARIQAEEESRRDEKLTYNCKCSFLEIYNEQITDLLDPSCTNLLLREDVKKGVYVENLSEFEVRTVGDIVNLLIQGSSNRKVAATNMNRESSRSHSVFTCVIESRWEKDSTTNLRFARLNLVDLAGSERQKTSGAEGERLKEAANINKSLSTLGHVIMVLVDVAQGKPRHIPYRDSRLTFLLQDSLGGNSKTMIIANVSPSICSAAETLNTLKFAQRAKMIQNNAVVNEDSSGDVTTLQHQIRLLKEELSILKRQNVSRSLSFGLLTADDTRQEQESGFPGHVCDMDVEDDDLLKTESKCTVRMSTKQLKGLETTLAGALRREQMAETCIKQLEAEIEQLNRLARQREEDTRCTKMMLRFREDKIRREEALINGSIPAESYLVQENRALSEEIKLLQAKLDKNPEVTRFALENIRLLDQLRRFQEFYEEGEREILLSEVSKLRDQLLHLLDGNSIQHSHPNLITEPEEAIYMNKKNDSLTQELEKTLTELEECRRNLKACLDENEKLSRELEDAQSMLINVKSKPAEHIYSVKTTEDSQDLGPLNHKNAVQKIEEMEAKHESIMTKNAEKIVNLQLELDILKIILKEKKWSAENLEERVICLNNELERANEDLCLTSKHHEDTKTELMEAKSVIEAMESQQILSINEMEDLRNSNSRYMQLLSKYEVEIMALQEQLALKELKDLSPTNCSDNDTSLLQEKVMRMQCSLEKAKRLNTWYQTDREFHVSNDEEMDQVRSQVEAETAEVIVCMQEELAILQQQVQDSHLKEVEMKRNLMLSETELKEVNEKVNLLSKDNESLSAKLEEKDIELRSLSEEWSLLTSEFEAVLSDGCELIIDASNQLEDISSSFSQKRIWISEHVGRMVRTIVEKELLIEELRRCLEDANNKQSDVESMLKSLRGAAMVITEAHQREYSEKEKDILALTSQLSLKASTIDMLENRLKLQEDDIKKASVCATVAFVIVNRLEEVNRHNLDDLKHKNIQLSKSEETNMRKDALLCEQAVVVEEAEKQIRSLRAELVNLEEVSSDLKQKLLEEQKRTYAMTEKLKDVEESNILVAKEKLAELKYGVSSLKSCMGTHVEEYKSLERGTQEDRTSFDGEGAGRIATEIFQDDDVDREIVEDSGTGISKSSLDVGKKVCSHSCDQDKFKSFPCEDKCDRDTAIILLRREMESALQSLQEVQVEMEKLRRENKDILQSERKNCKSMKCFANQIQNLLATLSDFEVQFKLKMEVLNQKLEASEQNVVEAASHLYETRELLELEVDDAKLVAAQKAAEVACILSKFEEAQDTMKEADIMINGLMIANETMKLEVKKLHKINGRLTNYKDILANKVQSLQSINIFKSQQCESFMMELCVKEFESLVLASELEEMAICKAHTQREHSHCCTIIENLKTNVILFKVDAELKDQLLMDKEVEVACQFSVLEQQKLKMQEELLMLESSSHELNNVFRKKEAELTRMIGFEKENELLKIEIENLNAENRLVLHNLEEKNSDVESYLGRINVFEKENHRLRDKILFLETHIAKLEMDFKLKTDELIIEKCVHLINSRLNILMEGGFVNVDKMLKEICETAEKTNEFMDQIECLKSFAKELESENMSLQTELQRKDDVLEGLLFDLSLLQESASNTKDQKDEMEEVMASLEALEDELLVKSIELNEAMAAKQMLEAQLHEKTDRITTLELSISKDCESLKVLCHENLELKAQLEDALTAKSSVEEDLTETRKVSETLEMELVEMGNAIDRLNDSIETLRSNLDELESERDQLQLEMLGLKNKLEAEQARAEEQEAIAKEAQQIAESKNIYVDEKEAEVKLLERSVEELEYTVNVLENKVDIVKGEAERQRLQREELELELHAIKQQTQNVENADADTRRFLAEKEKCLQEALTQIQILERDIVEKDSEIAQFKVHISELNLHAEAQASEYKQKFKALEAMAEQVRPEGSFLHALTASPKKTEKLAAKPRGSGSPFKCIGLGMVQQIKSERDEDLIAARLRIEELESLVASRQKEIFTLNTKLAAAESMTHDVIRDLLGVKLDMTTYVSLLDNQQVQKITEQARFHDLESQDMDQEVVKLKKQLTEFIKERQGWLEEIDRKQAEVVAAQVALEKLRQRDQLLKAENEMLKMENVNHKKKVMELEGEINKLSGQQNLHQRIHHHTKIKEENNTLKTQNADLSTKLRRTEVILSRVKEELASFRASNGRSPYIDFDEEKRLSAKLRETEEEKVQLAQKLLALCTSILKAAGITKPVNDINASLAEEVLEQLKNKITSMDREVQDLKYKSKITIERARLCELMPQSSPINTRADEKRQTPKKMSYVSDIDR